MKFSYKMAEKVAQPIAKILYERGYRKIDDIVNYVESVVNAHCDEKLALSVMNEIKNNVYNIEFDEV